MTAGPPLHILSGVGQGCPASGSIRSLSSHAMLMQILVALPLPRTALGMCMLMILRRIVAAVGRELVLQAALAAAPHEMVLVV